MLGFNLKNYKLKKLVLSVIVKPQKYYTLSR